MSILRYTGFVVPTLSPIRCQQPANGHPGVAMGHGLDALIFLMIPSMPMVSISRASTIWKPQ